jgi:hypothetical protein
MSSDRDRIEKALEIAVRFGGIDGEHHKTWTVDQMVRALTGCPMVEKTKADPRGQSFTYEIQGESEEYEKLVAAARAGEDGPETYEWDVGTPP